MIIIYIFQVVLPTTMAGHATTVASIPLEFVILADLIHVMVATPPKFVSYMLEQVRLQAPACMIHAACARMR
jgi:hypothetical protein